MEIIGVHRVTCANITDPAVDEMMVGLPYGVDVFYSDPPWGDGNMKFWTTMNRKMTGQVVQPMSYDQLLARIDQLIQTYVRGYVFIETGCRWAEQVKERFSRYLHNVQTHEIFYKAGGKLLPNVLVSAVTSPVGMLRTLDIRGRGAELPRRVIASVAKPGGVVLDPCCGMGYTARAAVAAGMRFFGNEFNAARLDKTIKFLRGKA